jgi:hypothetical protein
VIVPDLREHRARRSHRVHLIRPCSRSL